MANRIKIKGTTERAFDLGLTNKQTFDASGLTANRTWVLPDSNGTSGYVLATDGAGNLSWAPAGTGSPAGSNTQIQFNNAGAFGADSRLAFNAATGELRQFNSTWKFNSPLYDGKIDNVSNSGTSATAGGYRVFAGNFLNTSNSNAANGGEILTRGGEYTAGVERYTSGGFTFRAGGLNMATLGITAGLAQATSEGNSYNSVEPNVFKGAGLSFAGAQVAGRHSGGDLFESNGASLNFPGAQTNTGSQLIQGGTAIISSGGTTREGGFVGNPARIILEGATDDYDSTVTSGGVVIQTGGTAALSIDSQGAARIPGTLTVDDGFSIGQPDHRLSLITDPIISDQAWILPGTPGGYGQALVSQGDGVEPVTTLVWSYVGAGVPYFVPANITFRLPEFYQATFEMTIDAEGYLEIDGYLSELKQ